MTTYLLHVTIADVIRKLKQILISRNYEINYQNSDHSIVVAYSTNEVLKMVQVNLSVVNTYLELHIHSTCFSPGTSLLTNDSVEEEVISSLLEETFSGEVNSFRLTPEDYVFSFI